MKANKLYAALAITSLALPFTAVADDDISSRLANGKFSGEAFGGARMESFDLDDGSPDSDATDFTSDIVRLGYHANVKDNMIFGAELQLLPGSEATDSLSATRLQDLYFQWQYDQKTKTLGRFKQSVNRESAVELSDARFTQGASFDLGATNIQSSLGITSSEANAFIALLNGSARRVEGAEIKGFTDAGLNYTLALYKGGTDTTGNDSDRNFGYSGSLGWQGGDNNLQFGASIGLFMEAGNEIDDPTGGTGDITSNDYEGYRFSGNIATGPVTANLYFADNTVETDVDGGTSAPDIENSSFGISASFDFGGAGRSYDNFGILQGPNLSGNDWAFEGVINLRQDSIEISGVSGELDVDTWGLGVNAYCGQYTKIYGSYSSAEIDGGGSEKPSVDQLAVGVRFDF